MSEMMKSRFVILALSLSLSLSLSLHFSLDVKNSNNLPFWGEYIMHESIKVQTADLTKSKGRFNHALKHAPSPDK